MKDYYSTISIIKDELNSVNENISHIILKEKNFLTANFLSFIFTKSKKIRPVITILFLKCLYGKVSSSQIKICALVELFHNASLIHDDIIDCSDLRRNQPSFNKLFGNKTSVLAGDFLLASALKELASFNNSKIITFFAETFLKMCSGEIEQISQKNKICSIEEYLEKSRKKTAELFKICLKSALFAENQDKYLSIAENFCENFGLAFQILDDLTNFTAKKPSKPLNNDILNGIYTSPVIYFFKLNPNEKIDKNISEKIKKSPALEMTQTLCIKYADLAIDLIKDFSDNQYKYALINLCELLKKGDNNEN